MNWPATRPEVPNEPSDAPPMSKTSIAVAARIGDVACCPCASTAIPRGYCSWPGAGAERAPARAVLVGRRRPVADDAVVGVVGDVHAPGGSIGDVVGVAQLAGLRARAGADRADEAARRCRRSPAGGGRRRRRSAASRSPPAPAGASSRPLGTITTAREPSAAKRWIAVVARVGDVDRAVGRPRSRRRRRSRCRRRRRSGTARRRVPLEPHCSAACRRGRSDRSGRRRRRRRPSRRRRPRRAPTEVSPPGPVPAAPSSRRNVAVGAEDLDRVRVLVGDVDRAVGPDGDGLREAQHAAGALADDARRRSTGRDRRPGRRRCGGGAARISAASERGEQRAHRGHPTRCERAESRALQL